MSRWHPFTDLRILHMIPKAGEVWLTRSVGGHSGSDYVCTGQTIDLENGPPEHRRDVSEESDRIFPHAWRVFARENMADETKRRAIEIEHLREDRLAATGSDCGTMHTGC